MNLRPRFGRSGDLLQTRLQACMTALRDLPALTAVASMPFWRLLFYAPHAVFFPLPSKRSLFALLFHNGERRSWRRANWDWKGFGTDINTYADFIWVFRSHHPHFAAYPIFYPIPIRAMKQHTESTCGTGFVIGFARHAKPFATDRRLPNCSMAFGG